MSLSYLERFVPASQQLLKSRALLRRTDTKYLLSRDSLPTVLADVESQYALLYTAGRPYADYQTSYFDTPELNCFHDHRRGRRVRFKVRFRHYTDRQKTYLEVKRRGRIGTDKIRRSREFLDEALSVEDRAFLGESTGTDASRLHPTICNNFRRIMLVNLHGPERVTIDFELQFSQGRGQAELRDLVIVEVKQARLYNRSPLMLALRTVGVRPSSASKYCLGTLLLNPAIRSCRLGEVVRRAKSLQGVESDKHIVCRDKTTA